MTQDICRPTRDIEDKIVQRIDQDKDELVNLTQQLIRIPSVNPPGNEGAVAEVAGEELKRLGFESKFVEAERGRANLIAYLKGNKNSPRLCVYAHTDVVPPGDLKSWFTDPFGGAIFEGKIYGRGASDHKFPIAALTFAAKAIQDTIPSLDGDLIFAFTADEEMGSEKGLKYILEKGLVGADFGLYAGPTSAGSMKFAPRAKRHNVIIASNGFVSYRLTVKGKASHMMNLESGTNAIYKATKIITHIERLANRINRRVHPLTGGPKMSVNMIRAGQGESVIPDACEIFVDRFITPDETPEIASAELRRLIEGFRQRDSELSIEIEEKIRTPVARVPRNSYLVSVTRDTSVKVKGTRPAVVGIPSYTDMGWFQEYLHVPTVLFGYGDVMLAHKPNEHIAVQDLVDSAKAYALIILQVLMSKTQGTSRTVGTTKF